MTKLRNWFPQIGLGLEISLIIVWLSNLSTTDAYFSVYAIIGFAAFYLSCKNYRKDLNADYRLISIILSVVFSLLVVMGNYEIFTAIRDPERIQASTNLMVNLINTFLTLTGGCVVFFRIFLFVFSSLPIGASISSRSDHNRDFYLWAAVSFAMIAGIQLIHLFLVEYPGNVTEDPFTQISEMVAGKYSNFNTFWHTVFFQGILSLGYFLFGNVNAAVAFYCSAQALILAAAFVYCLMTLYLAGIPKWFLVLALAVYGILPYNIALSITVWKDVLFAAGCLLMGCSLFRIVKGLGSHKMIPYIIFTAGSLLFALSRANGWYVYFITFVIWFWPLRKNKKIIIAMASVAVIAWAMCNPVLKLLNVEEGDYTESLSVPLQQVSRVIADGCPLTDEETELISHVLDIDEVPEIYTNWISDPIKVEFRSNDTEYFEAHTSEYLKLWLRLGMRYPGEYLKAWVDQTKGYWNGGYPYAMYSESISDNPYGVVKAEQNNIIAKLFRIYFGLSRHIIFFEPLHSIGLHVWIVSVFCILNAAKKRQEWIFAIPALIVIAAMCVGTPVYACFRYAYPLFAVFPFYVGITLFSTGKQ